MIELLIENIKLNNIVSIRYLITNKKKELYNVLINNLYIFEINMNITIYNLLLDHIDNNLNLNLNDINNDIVKLLVKNNKFKHLTNFKLRYEDNQLDKLNDIIKYYLTDEILNSNINIINKIIIKLLNLQYHITNLNIIEQIYKIIKNTSYYIEFCKSILLLSYGYNNNDYLYYCYNYEMELFDWCNNENKLYLIPLLY